MSEVLMSEVRAGGGELILEAGRVRFRGPEALLTPRLLGELTRHKAEVAAALTREAGDAKERSSPDDRLTPAEDEAGFERAASEVLSQLHRAGVPLSHSALMRALLSAGYDQRAARKGIAECQAAGWIEHNLTTGYILAGRED